MDGVNWIAKERGYFRKVKRRKRDLEGMTESLALAELLDEGEEMVFIDVIAPPTPIRPERLPLSHLSWDKELIIYRTKKKKMVLMMMVKQSSPLALHSSSWP